MLALTLLDAQKTMSRIVSVKLYVVIFILCFIIVSNSRWGFQLVMREYCNYK